MEKVNGSRPSVGFPICPNCDLPCQAYAEAGFYILRCDGPTGCGWEEVADLLEDRDTDPGDVPPDAA